jgi:hypothetical protein
MNVTRIDAPRSSGLPRRVAFVVAAGLAVAGLGLLVHAALGEARLELVLVALGLGAAAALVSLLAASPASDVVVRRDG